MIENILGRKNEILPCSVHLNGEYGISGVYVGVPVKLGANGLEEIIVHELSENEMQALNKSAEAVEGLKKKIQI